MSIYTLHDLIHSTDRYKLYILRCDNGELADCISWLNKQKINTVNIGKELATFIDGIEDYSYLDFEVVDYLKKLMDKHKSKINDTGNEVVAVYNLGILLEPVLGLNSVQLLKDFAKATALIIIWENESDIPNRLHWPTQQNNMYFDFTETPLKKLDYVI